MIFDVTHTTRFAYEQAVSVSQHVLHLMPRETPRQSRLHFSLDVAPEPSQSTLGTDYFGNTVHFIDIQEPHGELVVTAVSRVNVADDGEASETTDAARWEDIVSLCQRGRAALDIAQFVFDSPYAVGSRESHEYALESFAPGRPIAEAALELTGRIFSDFEYQGGVSDVSTPVSEIVRMRKGVCQDFAHLELACLRGLGLPARYVSGYVLTHPPAGQEKLVGADASHAWISVWCGEAGWLDLDPTNNRVAGVEHITIGWGRDYGDLSPINGFILGGGKHTLDVAVDVRGQFGGQLT